MTLKGFDQISTNYEILSKIYQYLSFDNQLRLSRVNEVLKYVFETYIWKEKYSCLTVMCHEKFNYVITNGTAVNRICLKPHEFKEFQLCYGARVLELKIINCFLEMEIYQNEDVAEQLDIRKFPQLSRLYVKGMMVATDYLQLVAEVCPHLHSLCLENCVNAADSCSPINMDLNLEILAGMQQLKNLHMEFEWFLKFTIEYHKWQEIIRRLKLKSLTYYAIVQPETTSETIDRSVPSTLEELSMKTSLDCQKWGENFSSLLGNFQALSALTLEIEDQITEKILQMIAQNCENLEIFKILKTSFNSPTLTMPSKVKEFFLYECRGLTGANFRQLLTDFQIQKFSSKCIAYEAELEEDFQISPFIQILEMDCEYMSQLPKLLGATNETLKELKWHHPHYCRAAMDLPYVCPRLPRPSETAEDPMALLKHQQIKSLLRLTIPHPRSLFNWSHIIDLLRHPSLAELTILNGCGGMLDPQAFCNVPREGFATNILRLSIPLDIFEIALEFWLDLFGRNESMAWLCCTFDMCADYAEFLKKLIMHKLFARDLRTIDIFGFTIECNDLRRKFDATLAKLERENCEDLYRIIICR